LADYDGSGEALAPPPESRSDGELILALLPTLKRFLQALGIPLRSDADLQRAALQSIGNAGACGFTDGEGNPIPIDDKHQGAKRAPRLNLN
jgi:hypothetical protein